MPNLKFKDKILKSKYGTRDETGTPLQPRAEADETSNDVFQRR